MATVVRRERPRAADGRARVFASTFDGTNDYLSRGADLTGIADGKEGTLSFWVKFNGGDGSQQTQISNSNARFVAYRESTGLMHIDGRNAAASTILAIKSAAQVVVASGWTHVLMSWDLANGVAHIYIDDAESLAATPTLTDDTLEYTRADWAVGALAGGTFKSHASLAEVYLTTTYLDLSVEANRRKFITASKRPADLGPTGARPTGTAPIIYLKNPFSSFHINLGTGGDFTVNGELSAAASRP